MLSKNLTEYIYKSFDLLKLTEDHAETYLSLLKEGLCTTTALSKYSDIPRTTYYDLLEELIDWNLVREVKSKHKRLYECTEPYNLVEIITAHKNRCDDIVYYLKRNLHLLEKIYHRKQEESQIETVDIDLLEVEDLTRMLYRTRTIRVLINTDDSIILSTLSALLDNIEDNTEVYEYILKSSMGYLKEDRNSHRKVVTTKEGILNHANFIKIISDDLIIRINRDFYSLDEDLDGLLTEQGQFDISFNAV